MKIDISVGLVTVWMDRQEIKSLIANLEHCLEYNNLAIVCERASNSEARIEFVKEREAGEQRQRHPNSRSNAAPAPGNIEG